MWLRRFPCRDFGYVLFGTGDKGHSLPSSVVGLKFAGGHTSDGVHRGLGRRGITRARAAVEVFPTTGAQPFTVHPAERLYGLNRQLILTDRFAQVEHLPVINEKTVPVLCHCQPGTGVGVNCRQVFLLKVHL